MLYLITRLFDKDYQKTKKLFKIEPKVLIVVPRKPEWPENKVIRIFYNKHIFRIRVNKVVKVPERVANAINNCIKLI